MLMVGLSGGIGSGKSSVAARLAELGAIVVDADALAREAVAPGTDGLAEVVAEFGPAVLTATGELDRPAMGRLVFGDPQRRQALEHIVHPRVRARSAELIAAAPPDAVVVNDIPLLVETGQLGWYALVVMVFADTEVRVGRLVRDRGMTEADARARIAAQAGDEQRRAFGGVAIVNDGSLAELRAAVDALWHNEIATRLAGGSGHEGAARSGS
jgi:dephospho-CoA kinase